MDEIMSASSVSNKATNKPRQKTTGYRTSGSGQRIVQFFGTSDDKSDFEEDRSSIDRYLRNEDRLLATTPPPEVLDTQSSKESRSRKADLYKTFRKSMKLASSKLRKNQQKPYEALKKVKIPKIQHLRTMKALF